MKIVQHWIWPNPGWVSLASAARIARCRKKKVADAVKSGKIRAQWLPKPKIGGSIPSTIVNIESLLKWAAAT